MPVVYFSYFKINGITLNAWSIYLVLWVLSILPLFLLVSNASKQMEEWEGEEEGEEEEEGGSISEPPIR